MDEISGLLLTEAAPLPASLENAEKKSPSSVARQVEAVKDFESVFITKLLDAMETTIGDWGLEKDSTSKQVRGIFSIYLGRYLGRSGGFGMWKDIYKSLTGAEEPGKTIDSGG